VKSKKRNFSNEKRDYSCFCRFYLSCFDNRDKTVGCGFWLLGKHYDVHRFHPPLVYGRKGDAEVGEGICCCVGMEKGTERKIYMIICYELPIISSRAIP
jgi:hypothetical protein